MKLRSIAIVVALLAAASAAVWFARRSSQADATAADSRVGQTLAKADALTDAAKVTLTDDGHVIELQRAASGDWIVHSYHDLPADFSKLTRLVQDLVDTKIERFVTRLPAKIERLGFGQTRIAIADAKGDVLWAADLGKNADGGGRFVRLDGGPEAYLARLNVWIDSTAKNWADSALVGLKPDQVQKLEITFPDGAPIVVSREKAEDAFTCATTPADHVLQTSAVTTLLNDLTGLRFTDTAATDAPDAVSARDHARTVTLTTFDKHTYTLRLGRRPAPPPEPAKVETTPKDGADKTSATDDKTKDAEPKPPEAKPGPVYAFVTSDQADAKINDLTQKRAFEVSEFIYTGLPEKADALFTAAPKPVAAPTPALPAATPAAK